MSCVKPHLKVYREANPLACALALTCLRTSKSQKYMLMRENSNFSLKTHQKSWKGPCDPGSPGTSISYLQPAVNRQPGYHREDWRAVWTGMFHTMPGRNTKYSLKETRGRRDLFVNLRRFFEKILIFHAGATIFEIFYIESMLLPRCMHENLFLYRLLGRDQHQDRSSFRTSKKWWKF